MVYQARAVRVPLDCEAEIRMDGILFPCQAQSLSLTGISVTCWARPELEKPIWVGFESEDPPQWLSLQGVVKRYETTERDGFVWGIQFKGLDTTLIECLQRCLETLQSIFRQPPDLTG